MDILGCTPNNLSLLSTDLHVFGGAKEGFRGVSEMEPLWQTNHCTTPSSISLSPFLP